MPKQELERGAELLVPHRLCEVDGDWYFVPTGVVWTVNTRWIVMKHGRQIKGGYKRTYEEVCAYALMLRGLTSTNGLLKRGDKSTTAEWETCTRRGVKKNHNTDRDRCCDIFNERQILQWIKEIEECEQKYQHQVKLPSPDYFMELAHAAGFHAYYLPEKYRKPRDQQL